MGLRSFRLVSYIGFRFFIPVRLPKFAMVNMSMTMRFHEGHDCPSKGNDRQSTIHIEYIYIYTYIIYNVYTCACAHNDPVHLASVRFCIFWIS